MRNIGKGETEKKTEKKCKELWKYQSTYIIASWQSELNSIQQQRICLCQVSWQIQEHFLFYDTTKLCFGQKCIQLIFTMDSVT